MIQTRAKSLAVAISMLFLSGMAHANYKNEVCNGEDYIPKGNKYPHLHCGNKFYTYSKRSNKHTNMVGKTGAQCPKAEAVLEEIEALPPETEGKQEMEDSVKRFKELYCS